MANVKSKSAVASAITPAARFATKRTGSKAAQIKSAVTRAKPSENFERIGKGKDVVFSGAWKPGRVLSSKS